jgi:hypothetical protein
MNSVAGAVVAVASGAVVAAASGAVVVAADWQAVNNKANTVMMEVRMSNFRDMVPPPEGKSDFGEMQSVWSTFQIQFLFYPTLKHAQIG